MGTVDLNDVATFVAVADAGGFSEAARRLELPKSTVSRTVARLEASMRVRLLHRTTRQVTLSTAGAALYDKAAPLVATLRQSVGALPELEEEPSGTLRITTAVDFAHTVLAEIVARFVARYPSVDVQLLLTNEHVDLVAERIDVAVRLASGRLRDSSLTARKAATFRLQLYASPEYLARRGVPRTAGDLEAHEMIRFRYRSVELVKGDGETTSVVPRGRIQCDDMSFLRAVVLEGAGIGVMPTFIAEPLVAQGRLVRVLPRHTVSGGDVWIVHAGGRQVPRKVSAFSDFVIESLKNRKY